MSFQFPSRDLFHTVMCLIFQYFVLFLLLCSFLLRHLPFSIFYHFLLCCTVFSIALLSRTGRPRSPERSLRNSGSTLTLLLPAVSRAYKQAGKCLCLCVHACVCATQRPLTPKAPLTGGLLTAYGKCRKFCSLPV